MEDRGMEDLPIVDAHMHLWDLDRLRYGWLQDDPLPNNPAGDISPIAHRSYLLDDYLADAAGWNVVKAVHIECGLPPKDQLVETDWLQGLATRRGYPQAIVAGAVLEAPDLEGRLELQASRPNVRGVRQIINWHRDPLKTYTPHDLLQDDGWRAGFARLARLGLSFDLQLYPSQMPAAAELAARHPDIRLIVNHAGICEG
jgi:predicted TIM-barrel fold metal-dependent hydrolase